MTYFYERSEIYNFFDLTEEQQKENVDYLGLEGAEQTSYVILRGDALPLCMFLRTNGNFIHGYYGQTNTSAYGVTLSRCNSEAVVSYRG